MAIVPAADETVEINHVQSTGLCKSVRAIQEKVETIQKTHHYTISDSICVPACH